MVRMLPLGDCPPGTAAGLAGCGPTPTVVSVTLTLDGRPGEGATLEFYPAAGDGQTSHASSDKAGAFHAKFSPGPLTSESRNAWRACPCPESRRCFQSQLWMAERSQHRESGGQRAPIRPGGSVDGASVRRRGLGSPDPRKTAPWLSAKAVPNRSGKKLFWLR